MFCRGILIIKRKWPKSSCPLIWAHCAGCPKNTLWKNILKSLEIPFFSPLQTKVKASVISQWRNSEKSDSFWGRSMLLKNTVNIGFDTYRNSQKRIYSSVHINESKVIWCKSFVNILGKYIPTNSTAEIRQNMILSHLFILLEIIFFHQIFSISYFLWIIKRQFNISSKNGAWIHFSQFSANYKFTEIAAKIKIFLYFELISCIYFDLKKVFNNHNLFLQVKIDLCWKCTRTNPCSGGRFLN